MKKWVIFEMNKLTENNTDKWLKVLFSNIDLNYDSITDKVRYGVYGLNTME